MQDEQNIVGSANTLSMLSLILGILFVVAGPLASIPGLICGIVALVKFNKHGIKKGRGLAISGIITSFLGVLVSILFYSFIMKIVNDDEFLKAVTEMMEDRFSETPVSE